MRLAEILINRGASITELEVNAFVWRIRKSNGVGDFHSFWDLLRYWRPWAPTRISMAPVSRDPTLVHRLLVAGVDPRGRPLAYQRFEAMAAIREIDKDAFVLNGSKCGEVAVELPYARCCPSPLGP